jgi:hypothetical protein
VRKGARRAAHAKHWAIAAQGRLGCPSACRLGMLLSQAQYSYIYSKGVGSVAGVETRRGRCRGGVQQQVDSKYHKHGEASEQFRGTPQRVWVSMSVGVWGGI